MPRLADHEERRARILGALLRIAGDRGLHAVSMRTVAAEAGVTVSTVQYYFQTKERLLLAGLEYLADVTTRRALGRTPASPRDTVRTWLVQMIPADAEQRMTYTVFAAYHALALTDPALAEQPYANRSAGLERGLSDYLRAADLPPEVDPDVEAANLLALATGLGDGVMAGLRTAESAVAHLDYYLERLFRPSSPRR